MAARKKAPAKPKATKKPVVKKPAGKAGGLRPTNKKGAKELQMLTEIGKLTDAQVPEHWPQNCRLNPRAFSKLPEGWYHAKMVTGESGRGTGGNMARLFVGPYDEAKGKRVQFWHKTDLEKHLGYKLEQESEENPRIHPRIMNPELLKTFPDDAILHRVHEKKARADYINKRCDDLDGKTVREALMDFHYEYEGGIMCSYGSSDLKYDEKDGRIWVQSPAGANLSESRAPAANKASKMAAASSRAARMAASKAATGVAAASKKAKVLPAGKAKQSRAQSAAIACALGHVLSRQSAAGSNATTTSTEHVVQPLSSKRGRWSSSSISLPTRELAPAHAPSKASAKSKAPAASRKSAARPSSSSSSSGSSTIKATVSSLTKKPAASVVPKKAKVSADSEGLLHIKKHVFEPLKTVAAVGKDGWAAIYQVLGVGHKLGMDAKMLKTLEEVFREQPEQRSPYGRMHIKMFEDQLNKALK